MNDMSARLIRASSRVYHLLLLTYPARFRREYGPQMEQVFRDCCRDDLVQHGWPGFASLWLRTLADVGVTAAKERIMARRTERAAVPQLVITPSLKRDRAMGTEPHFHKFTKRAKRVLNLAVEEARAFNHPYIGTEHLLLGMLREGDGVAARVLGDAGVKLANARKAVEFIVGVGEGPPRQDQDLTARAKKVIEYAVAEADQLHHRYVGTEHLLLGLARLNEGVATGVLDIMGVQLEQLRTTTLAMLSVANAGRWQNMTQTASPAPSDEALRLQIKLIHDKLTTRAWRALVGACLAARNVKLQEVDPEFLLFDLAQDNGVAGQALRSLNISYEQVVQELTRTASIEPVEEPQEVQISARLRQVLGWAAAEALRLNSEHIGTEHLLLGACKDAGVADVLAQLGTTPDQVRAAVLLHMPQE